jgi:hypothetical protein
VYRKFGKRPRYLIDSIKRQMRKRLLLKKTCEDAFHDYGGTYIS